MLDEIGIESSQYPNGHPERAIFCSRTLNLRAIQAIGAWQKLWLTQRTLWPPPAQAPCACKSSSCAE